MNKKITIHIISTGGTIEKTYDEEDGTLFNRESVIKKRINSSLRLPYTDIRLHCVMSKDSLDMDDKDRELIVDKIKELAKTNNPIVVLHGTDTMQQTAELANSTFLNINVPVVFTGAMKPLGFQDSDALQNVTEALIACQFLSADVYVVFHNRVFNVPGVRKNKALRTFEEF